MQRVRGAVVIRLRLDVCPSGAKVTGAAGALGGHGLS